MSKADKFSMIVTSPTGTKVTQGKNLTGSPRRMRDLAADIHSNIQNWNSLHLDGVSLLNAIVQGARNSENDLLNLQESCDELETICDGLDDVAKNLRQIAQHIRAITQLHTDAEKLFSTWPVNIFGKNRICSNIIKSSVPLVYKILVKDFYKRKRTSFVCLADTANYICKAYSDETKVKRLVLENVLHHNTESSKMLHLAGWVHQPSLPAKLSIYLESLLIETGHK